VRKLPLVLAVTAVLSLPLERNAVGGVQAEQSVGKKVDQTVRAAKSQVGRTLHYDPAYQRISYPGGDVLLDRGVCSDVIIRAFRAAGVDLQKEVHEDMAAHFAEYPQRWGLRAPDRNIDHRRVPNLMKYFQRQKKALPIPVGADAVQAGDLVAWNLGGGALHIAIATVERTPEGRPLFVHNIGQGARLEDILFSWKIIGHYRYFKTEGNS